MRPVLTYPIMVILLAYIYSFFYHIPWTSFPIAHLSIYRYFLRTIVGLDGNLGHKYLTVSWMIVLEITHTYWHLGSEVCVHQLTIILNRICLTRAKFLALTILFQSARIRSGRNVLPSRLTLSYPLCLFELPQVKSLYHIKTHIVIAALWHTLHWKSACNFYKGSLLTSI